MENLQQPSIPPPNGLVGWSIARHRTKLNWKTILRSCGVALAGLAALLALEFGLYHFHPCNRVVVVVFFAAFGLIVWGMIAGLEWAGVSKAAPPKLRLIIFE